MADQEVPYINTYVYKPEQRHACVGFDNRLAGRKLANHLIDLGHRTIGMIGGISYQNDRARERILGVREALLENGLELPDHLLTEKPYDIASGREALRYFLQPPGAPQLSFAAVMFWLSAHFRNAR